MRCPAIAGPARRSAPAIGPTAARLGYSPVSLRVGAVGFTPTGQSLPTACPACWTGATPPRCALPGEARLLSGCIVGIGARASACVGSPGHAPGDGAVPAFPPCSSLCPLGAPTSHSPFGSPPACPVPEAPSLLRPLSPCSLISLSPPASRLIFPTYRRRATQCLSFQRSSPNGSRGQCKIGPASAIGPGWPWVVEWESGFLCVCSAPEVFAFLRLSYPKRKWKVGCLFPTPVGAPSRQPALRWLGRRSSQLKGWAPPARICR